MSPEEIHAEIAKEFEYAFDTEARRLDIHNLWQPWLNTAYTINPVTILSKRRIDTDLGFSIQLDAEEHTPVKATLWRTFGSSTSTPVKHFVIFASRDQYEAAFWELRLFLESTK